MRKQKPTNPGSRSFTPGRRYPGLRGKVVGWVEHRFEEGLLYLHVRFTDKTELCWRISTRMTIEEADLSNWKSGDFEQLAFSSERARPEQLTHRNIARAYNCLQDEGGNLPGQGQTCHLRPDSARRRTPGSVIFPGTRHDAAVHNARGFWTLRSAKLAHKALHRLIARPRSRTPTPGLARWPCRCVLLPGPVRLARGTLHRHRPMEGKTPWFGEKSAIKSGVTMAGFAQSRGAPRWPVLPALGVPIQAGTPSLRLFLGRCSRSLCAHRWLPRCAAATIRAFLVR